MQSTKRITFRHVLLIAGISIVAMLPAYFGGVPGGNDQSQHFQFAATIYKSVASGDLYPSFAPDTNHGLGDYGIRFYPPLTYYALSAGYLVTRDWYFASLVVFTLVFFFGGLGIYLWARESFEPPHALFAALLYTVAPYHLNQLYNNALFAEFFATAVFPFCFLFLVRVCRDAKWLDALGLAIAYALLILSHLPLTIICSIAMGIYGLLLLRQSQAFKTLAKLAASVAAAVVMTAFYWSRFLTELEWITHSSPKYFSTTWDYKENYLLVPDHLLKFGENSLNLWFADIMLAATLLVVVPTVIYLLRRRAEATKFVVAGVAVLAISVFMTTPLSSPIWNSLGFLQKVQFPWRWMVVISAFVAVLAPVGIIKASDQLKGKNSSFAILGLGAVLATFFFTATFVTRGAMYVYRSELNRQTANIAESESCDCWWPVWATRQAFEVTKGVDAGYRPVASRSWTARNRHFTIEPGEPTRVKVKTFYYPRWQATINMNPVTIVPDESGLIAFDVPAESSEVELTFIEPPFVKYANLVSGAAWLMILAFGAVMLIKSRRFVPKPAV